MVFIKVHSTREFQEINEDYVMTYDVRGLARCQNVCVCVWGGGGGAHKHMIYVPSVKNQYKRVVIQVENKNMGLKVCGGGGGTNIPLPPQSCTHI